MLCSTPCADAPATRPSSLASWSADLERHVVAARGSVEEACRARAARLQLQERDERRAAIIVARAMVSKRAAAADVGAGGHDGGHFLRIERLSARCRGSLRRRAASSTCRSRAGDHEHDRRVGCRSRRWRRARRSRPLPASRDRAAPRCRSARAAGRWPAVRSSASSMVSDFLPHRRQRGYGGRPDRRRLPERAAARLVIWRSFLDGRYCMRVTRLSTSAG